MFLIAISYPQDILTTDTINKNIKIYLDCLDCDFSFFRRNLTFIDFVRDAKLADVHILVTKQKTAGDGIEYGINFIGINHYSDLGYKLKTISPYSDTDILKWERLLKKIEIGVLPYLSMTPEIENIKILYDNKIHNEEELDSSDPWDYWVFQLGLGSEFQAEESQSEYSLSTSFDADRISETMKFKSELSYNLNKETYNDDDEIIKSNKMEAEFDADLVYSINPRWSLGILGDISKSSFLNIYFASNIGTAIEYNIFPWDKSDRKVFTIAYQLNTNYYKYNKLTIFNKKEEWRASESLELSLILKQPWGDIENTLEMSHFFYDFSKNRLSLGSDVSINIAKGLSFFIDLEAELIHDQLYLPAGDATREELLLRQRKLGTAFEILGNIGIQFTFGSVYNNIVNQRLK
ncbi:hypothetical protein ACFL3O_00085 [Candidatus Neomarinimicrobiota bacterium]